MFKCTHRRVGEVKAGISEKKTPNASCCYTRVALNKSIKSNTTITPKKNKKETQGSTLCKSFQFHKAQREGGKLKSKSKYVTALRPFKTVMMTKTNARINKKQATFGYKNLINYQEKPDYVFIILPRCKIVNLKQDSKKANLIKIPSIKKKLQR